MRIVLHPSAILLYIGEGRTNPTPESVIEVPTTKGNEMFTTQYVYPEVEQSEKCEMCEKRNAYEEHAGMRVCGKCAHAIDETEGL